MSVGFGYDVHKLVEGRKLILGGVEIPYHKGLLGWSDGDVLIHAIIDALLGAMGRRDIGQYFPPGDPKYKNISSLKLLAEVTKFLRSEGTTIKNIDSTIVAEEPKLALYLDAMKDKIASVLDIDPNLINIKAKTEEGLGFTGEKRGIKAYAVALL